MKKVMILILIWIFYAGSLFAQRTPFKIVFDFTKGDTASFATMARHAKNIMDMTGHGPGLDLLIKDKTTVQKEIEELQGKFNVVFAACEVTMKRRGIDQSQLLLQTITVPLALLELSSKQQDGWTYIKAGY
jgi:intracellular sulfur oxidation DsrE/DsrF family protein